MPAGCAALDQARSIDDGFSLAQTLTLRRMPLKVAALQQIP
jgi:hypothetical protein